MNWIIDSKSTRGTLLGLKKIQVILLLIQIMEKVAPKVLLFV